MKDSALHSFQQTKDSANEVSANARVNAAENYNQAAGYTQDASNRFRDSASEKYNQASDTVGKTAQNTQRGAQER